MGKIIQLTGQKFGKLTIIRFAGIKYHKAQWECVCDCGKTKIICGYSLTSGLTKSCGCQKAQITSSIKSKHKMCASLEYSSWCSMKRRCLNPKDNRYKYYGAKGISIYPEWIHNFDAFYKYMGSRPSPKHSLDRFPNQKGNYEPGNVRWATQYQQLSNFSRNRILEFNGERKILAEWARIFKITSESIRYHLQKGRPFDKIARYYLSGRCNIRKHPIFH